jgi:hypothetical protein
MNEKRSIPSWYIVLAMCMKHIMPQWDSINRPRQSIHFVGDPIFAEHRVFGPEPSTQKTNLDLEWYWGWEWLYSRNHMGNVG